MEVIYLETEAFYKLVEDVVVRLNTTNGMPDFKWIDSDEAMKLLGISSKTTLQNYRDNGDIRFTQPRKRVILYDRDSILEFLEGNAKNKF
jgi:hypothetical protein